jgi:hypothetical protein
MLLRLHRCSKPINQYNFGGYTERICACQCYTDSLCINGAFIGINQSCTLYSASLQQGQIQAMINSDASLISFTDRINNSSGYSTVISMMYTVVMMELQSIKTQLCEYYQDIMNYLNLTTTSFTISAWIQIPYGNQLAISDYFILFCHCEYAAPDKCLHLGTVNEQLFLGFNEFRSMGITSSMFTIDLRPNSSFI